MDRYHSEGPISAGDGTGIRVCLRSIILRVQISPGAPIRSLVKWMITAGYGPAGGSSILSRPANQSRCGVMAAQQSPKLLVAVRVRTPGPIKRKRV